MIESLNFREKSSSNFIFVFCYRRLMQSLLIVFLSDRFFIQIQVMTAGTIFFIILAGWSGIYKHKYDSRLNYSNEVSLLIQCYTYFVFSAFVP